MADSYGGAEWAKSQDRDADSVRFDIDGNTIVRCEVCGWISMAYNDPQRAAERWRTHYADAHIDGEADHADC